MKYLKISAIAILLICLSFISCEKEEICTSGMGAITTKNLSIPGFTGVDLAEAANVVLSQGTTQEVKVTGHPNIIDKIETQVSGGIWTIDLEEDCYDSYELTVYITVPNINDISLSGTGDIKVNDFTNQGDLSLDLGGSGDITLNAFDGAENLAINISGSGTITGNNDIPTLKKLDISITGSGDYDGFEIKTDECKINIAGSGNCAVYVRDLLDVTITGSGVVHYKGDPTINENSNPAGHVVDAN